MKTWTGIIGVLIITGFLAYEWRLQHPEHWTMSITSQAVNVQSPTGLIWRLGTDTQTKPFGYLFNEAAVFEVAQVGIGQSRADVTRWSENFWVLDARSVRVFYLNKGFQPNQLHTSPVKYHSDIWVLSGAVPPTHFPPPRDFIVWLSNEKRLPKSIKEFGIEHQIPVLEMEHLGETRLQLIGDEWQIK